MASATLAKISAPRFRVFPTVTSDYLWRIARTSEPETTLYRFHHLEFAMVAARAMNEQDHEETEKWSQCSYCSPESRWGACDGGQPCPEIATVHDLESDQAFCLKHFPKRGGAR